MQSSQRAKLAAVLSAAILGGGIAIRPSLSQTTPAETPAQEPAQAPAAESAAPPQESAGRLRAPIPPEHKRRNLTTIGELARDCIEVVNYLDQGQVYFRAYQKRPHTVEENAEFLRFLETYERELEVAKKEVDALRSWVRQKGSLDSVASEP